MAVICFICEGSYPYIVGGVSSWVHELITSNPQHFFKILCIIPNKEFAKLKYKVPKNVVEIKNLYMDPYLNFSYLKVLKDGMEENRNKEKSIEELLHFQITEEQEKLDRLENVFSKELGTPLEIVLSKEYWNVLLKYYEKYHSKGNFSTYYWTYRNIILNLLKIGQESVPKANIYHSVTTGYAGFICSLIAHRKKGKFLLTEHGIYPREREEEILGATWIDRDFKSIWIDYFYYLSKLAYKYADKIISLFEYNRQIQIEYGAPEEKTIVIPNGVDEKKYGSIIRKKRDGFHIGSVLRVVPIKDLKMMIKGFKIASEKMPDAVLWLIGPTDEDEDYYKECLQLVENLQLKEKVIFTGRADVTEYYSFLDLLLLTSISEGQPLSILEGLASGIPFIATDVGNCREILIEKKEIGEAGIIIPPTSYIDLAEALVTLYNSPEKLEKFSENGKIIIDKYYRKKDFIENYRKIYDELGG
ncbi:MAG: GT4 family glycosyltransferase PelF [Leptotrichiaceae bacterium]|nr:GT4 family glycosyltransferase PelF [Leptotrichiaceae bacterium]